MGKGALRAPPECQAWLLHLQAGDLRQVVVLSMPWFTCKVEAITKTAASEVTAFVIMRWEGACEMLTRVSGTKSGLSNSDCVHPSPGTFIHTNCFNIHDPMKCYFPWGN